MRGPAARFLGIALAAAGVAAAAPVAGSPASAERYEDGLAAYQRNDFAKALRLLRPLAEKGDARAQYLLGRQYQFGQGVKVSRAEAFYWYKRAEAKGHLEAKLFRQLLEKRWKITAAEKGQAERRLAAEARPAPHAAHAEAKRTPARPAPAKPAPEIAAKEKPKAAPAKPKVETAHAKLPEPPKPAPAKAKVEIAKAAAPPPETSAVVAAPDTRRPMESQPTVPRGRAEIARAAPPADTGGFDDEGDLPGLYRNGAPPAETRTPVAAAPAPPTAAPPADPPPGGDDYASDPPPNYPPPSYAPPPYYGPAPYYAPAAPPTWRASSYYRPRPAYRPAWGYRPYARYVHPGWRGAAWRGYRPW